jgi:hypothetical protein
VPTYDAALRVQVALTYYVVLETEADTPEEAEDKLRWQAMGMTYQELNRLLEDGHNASNQLEGAETTVQHVGQVGPPGWAPEDDEARLEAEAFEPLAHQPERLDDGGPPLESPTSGR